MNFKKNKLKIFFIYLIISVVTLTILISSILSIYMLKDKISNRLSGYTEEGKVLNNFSYSVDRDQAELAKDIVENGGYILYFRHGHREKWIDVAMYDAMEALEQIDANNHYFKSAVCLSKMGIIQVRMMGEIIKKINVPVGNIITSPSCRARQTSQALFGTVGIIDNLFLHPGPYNENLAEFKKSVKKTILKLEVSKGTNSIISAHNGIIKTEVFDVIKKNIKFNLEEGGFYVIKKIDAKLVLIDKFHNFNNFSQIFFKRPK